MQIVTGHTLRPVRWTHGDTDDGVPGWWVEVFLCPSNIVIVQQRDDVRQRGERDIGHAVGLLDVDDCFSNLLEGIESSQDKSNKSENTLKIS